MERMETVMDDNVGMLRRWQKTTTDPMIKNVLSRSMVEILTSRKTIRELKRELRKRK